MLHPNSYGACHTRRERRSNADRSDMSEGVVTVRQNLGVLVEFGNKPKTFHLLLNPSPCRLFEIPNGSNQFPRADGLSVYKFWQRPPTGSLETFFIRPTRLDSQTHSSNLIWCWVRNSFRHSYCPPCESEAVQRPCCERYTVRKKEPTKEARQV